MMELLRVAGRRDRRFPGNVALKREKKPQQSDYVRYNSSLGFLGRSLAGRDHRTESCISEFRNLTIRSWTKEILFMKVIDYALFRLVIMRGNP